MTAPTYMEPELRVNVPVFLMDSVREREERRRELEAKQLEQAELEHEDLEREKLEREGLEEAELDEDFDDLEAGIGVRAKRPKNIVEKLELARIKRALDRGEKLSPGEIDTLGASRSPEAKKLMDINRARQEPKGFTLSPVRALVRGL